LLPLGAQTVRHYLRDDAAGPVAKARWNPVLTRLGTKAPVGQALGTPLMVGLARTIYNPRPGELVGTLRDPKELCSLRDRAAVEALLFDAFISVAYRQDFPAQWTKQDATKWLIFLARYLEYGIEAPDLAWWQLWRSLTIRMVRFTVDYLGQMAIFNPNGFRESFSLRELNAIERFMSPQQRAPFSINSAASPQETLAQARRVAILAGTQGHGKVVN
jgi:hypothetical protein